MRRGEAGWKEPQASGLTIVQKIVSFPNREDEVKEKLRGTLVG